MPYKILKLSITSLGLSHLELLLLRSLEIAVLLLLTLTEWSSLLLGVNRSRFRWSVLLLLSSVKWCCGTDSIIIL